MNILSLDIGQTVVLGTHVAQAGSIRIAEMVGDEVFDYIIGIVALVHAMDPGS